LSRSQYCKIKKIVTLLIWRNKFAWILCYSKMYDFWAVYTSFCDLCYHISGIIPQHLHFTLCWIFIFLFLCSLCTMSLTKIVIFFTCAMLCHWLYNFISIWFYSLTNVRTIIILGSDSFFRYVCTWCIILDVSKTCNAILAISYIFVKNFFTVLTWLFKTIIYYIICLQWKGLFTKCLLA